jgi:cardiolipin synthase A/B
MKDKQLPPLRAGHQVQLLQGGREFFPELVRAIERSVHEVRLETYIFHFDPSGKRVAGALARAARRGVAVYLVMDGVGTPFVPKDWARRFDEAGVQWQIFQPLGHLGLLIPSRWRRLHRKLCVIDGQVAFCGGINVLDDWVDHHDVRLPAPRFDFALRVSGPLVRSVHEVMVQFWWRLQAVRDVKNIDLAASWSDLEQAVRLALQAQADNDESHGSVHAHGVPAAAGTRAALLLRDNLRHRSRIERAYRKAIGEAHEEIIIANAYFQPGRKLRQALIHAAQRGVRVRLLLQGRYEYFMQFHAVRMVYGVLLRAGIEIHEYEPSFLHAKVAVIDRRWATVGSSNLEPLSLLLAREANVVVVDEPFAGELRARLVHAMENEGRRVDPASYAHRPWQQRLLDRVAFGLMRAMIFLYGKRY